MYFIKNKNLTGKISFLIVLQYSILIIKNLLVSSNLYLQSINNYINILIIIFLFLLFINLILKNIKNINFLYVQNFIIIGIIIFWLLSFFNNKILFSYSYVNAALRDFIAYSLPLLLFVPMLNKTDRLLEYFYKASYFMLMGVLFAVLFFLYNNFNNIDTAYSMSFGRNAMFPAILLYSKSLTQGNKRDFILASLIVGTIIIYGSRFPLLCISFYLFIKILLSLNFYKKLVIFFVSTPLLIITYLNITSLAKFALNVLGKFDIQSRTLYLLSSGMGGYSSGRGVIHQQLYTAINKSPIWGYGAGGGTIILDNGLSHGLVIDIFANFGYLIGGLILIISLSSIFYAFNKTYYNSDKELLIIIISNFLPISTIQLGLWTADKFWFAIALSLSILKFNYNRTK